MPERSEYSLTAGQVAALLHCGLSTVARWADKGDLPSQTSPGGWRKFRPEDVETFREKVAADRSGQAS